MDTFAIEVTSVGANLVSLDDAKRHLNIEHGDDDLLILAQIAAATRWAEHRTGSYFTATSLTYKQNGFGSCISLKSGPILDVTSVVYDDVDGVEQTLATDQYDLDKYNRVIRPAYGVTWPSARYHWNSVRVSYRCGYVTGSPETDNTPQDVKSAVLLVVGDLYEHREAQQDMALYSNAAANMLIEHYRRYQI